MQAITWFILLQAGTLAVSVQQPLSVPPFLEEADGYQFDWPIRKVAVIGAGPSGLVAYRELTEAGLDVRIFERDSVPGGNWHYTEEVPLDAPVPNAPAAIGDFVPSLPPADIDLPYSIEFEDDGEVWRSHRGPRPVWESLTSNAASSLQQFPQWPWPVGTPWELSHYQIRNYVRSYASYLNINSNDENPAVAYNTRVELIEKRINEAGKEQGWRLWLKSLKSIGGNKYQATWWTEDFDAVAVAVGKYNAPLMPSIPGLEEWVRKFPGLVRHSRQYRRPETYVNQTVLIVGAAVSGSQISRDLNHQAAKIYQSIRLPELRIFDALINSKPHRRLEKYLRRIPKNTTFVGEIKQFLPICEGFPIQSGLVELKNGTVLSGIDSVVLATGFRYSFPFLPQYYDGATYLPDEGSATTVSPFLPLDGSHIRDLYLDIFDIQDPTLAFLGMGLGTQPFSLSDYTTLALAKVWSNSAKLPTIQGMRGWYEMTVEERGGYGKRLMLLGRERVSVILRYLIGWLNASAVKYGGKQIDGLPKYTAEVAYYWRNARYGRPSRETISDENEALLASLRFAQTSGMEQERGEHMLVSVDEW